MLHAQWRHEAAGLGWDREAVWRQITAAAKRIRRDRAGQQETLGWAVADAVTAAGRARAAFSRADLAIEIATRLRAVPATAEQVRAIVERLTDTGLTRGGAVFVGAPRHGDTARQSDPRYATPELLAAEARVLDRAAHGQQAGYAVADPTTAELQIRAGGLDPDQRPLSSSPPPVATRSR